MRRILFLIAIVLLLSAPALADTQTITATNIQSYSVASNPGYVIYQIHVDPVNIGQNQTHTLNFGGATYILTVGSYKSTGIYNNFDISLTLPNGTVISQHPSIVGLLNNQYALEVNPVFSQAQEGYNTYLTTDVQAGVGQSTLSVGLNAAPLGWSPTSAIAFSAVSGNTGAQTNVFVYEITQADFQNNIQNYNPVYGISNLGSTVFQWTWNAVIGFLNMIPVIGPLAVTFLTYAGMFLTELMFWLGFLLTNFPSILLGSESLICLMAVINAGSGKNSFGKLFRNILNYNIMVFQGLIFLFNLARDWIVMILQTIALIIKSLNPV